MQIRFHLYIKIILVLLSFSISDANDRRFWVSFKPEHFNSPAKKEALQKRLIENGFKPFRTSNWLNAISGTSTPAIRAIIQNWPEVLETREVASFSKRDSANSAAKRLLIKKNGIESKYGQNLTAYELCKVTSAHKVLDSLTGTTGTYGNGVKIAIFDAGFTLRHESIKHLLDSQIIAKRDYVRPLWDTAFTEPFDTIIENEPGEYYDQEEHGTSVLSLIAGKKDGVLHGIAPAASFILAKTEITYKARLNSFNDTIWEASEVAEEEDNWIAAAEWAVDTMGAKIISSSLGYRDDFTDGRLDYPNSMMDGKTLLITVAAESAYAHGAIVVKSIGNSHHNTITTLSAPADGNNVIAVGAVDANGVLATYSSSGPTFDGRIKPDVLAPGHQILAAIGRNNQYANLNGTSFAAPLAAGMVALAIQYDTLTGRNISNDSLIKRIRKTASSPASFDTTTPGWGYGIMNAYSAMTGIEDSTTTTEPKPKELSLRVVPIPVSRGKELFFQGFTDNSLIADERVDTLFVTVLTLSGKRVVNLTKKEEAAGALTNLRWNLTNIEGNKVTPGIYLYVARFKQKEFKGKIAIVR